MRRWSSLTIAWGSFPAVTEGCSRLQGLHQAIHHTRLVTFCREDRVACQSSISCRTHSHTVYSNSHIPRSVVRIQKNEYGSKRKSKNRTAKKKGKWGRGQREPKRTTCLPKCTDASRRWLTYGEEPEDGSVH